MQCGLLGEKLKHSYSPQIHSYLGNYTYELFEKAPDELGSFLKNGQFTGLNVTIPYKKSVLPFCDELSDCAQKLGAVNTIIRRPDGTLIGHNTDYFGFYSMLNRSGLSVVGKKVLVLGSGGASATVVAVLKECGASVIVISRTGENNYFNLSRHVDASVIVNTTPVGMYPNTDASPVELNMFPNLEGVLDVIYNPARTKLLQDAQRQGLITQNGLWMLVAQAKESAEWFIGKEIEENVIAKIHGILRKQMENIVFVGMPGCGKSTIGKLIAQQLEKRFVDTDEEIVKLTGMSIPEIFKQFGESQFRQYETTVLKELGKQSGLVIATGGGCVTRAENHASLHQNGNIIWIQRDIAVLPVDGRPLSQQNKLHDLYQIRKPMYEVFSDHVVMNNGELQDTIRSVLSKVGYYENSCNQWT